MGISFKISKTGRRFKPKPVISESATENSLESSKIPSKNESNGKDEDALGPSGSSLSSVRCPISAEDEVSFTLNLYPDGYSIGKPSENDSGLHAAFQEGSKLLHPYDRTSEGLFSAVESGRLPGGILDDIPCKYEDGTLICEVRDYRKCRSGSGANNPSVDGSAMISKVRLKMSLENVVKDIRSIADDSWTYGDLMEVESRILRALQPKLCLDPTPKLDRLCTNPVSSELNLGLVGVRKRRLRRMPEVTVTSNNRPHGKKICIDRAPESSSYRIGELGSSSADMISHNVQDNIAAQGIGHNNNILGSRPRDFVQDASFPALNSTTQISKIQAGPGNQRNMHDHMQNSANVPGVPPAGPDLPISYAENMKSTAFIKKEQEGQLAPYSTFNKRARTVSVGPDGVQQQQIGPYGDGIQGPDVQWRNHLMQQQPNARGIQYANPGMQKYSQLVVEGVANQDSIKLEKADASLVKNDIQMMEADGSHMDPRQRIQQNPYMRPAFQQPNWNNLTQQVEKDSRKDDQLLKRKSIQSPRLSTGAVAQSPLSAKSGEISCGSMGTPYGAVSSAASLGQLQREKSAVTSIPAVDRTTSMTSSANDSMPQHQAQLAAKRRSNSFSKTPAISAVGSPVSVNNMGGPMNASSPSISTPQLADQSMIERFAKLEVVAMRHQLNCKKNKVDDFARKSRGFSAQELSVSLSSVATNESFKDENCTTPMSKSLVGGSMNVCKIRLLNLRQERTVQGNPVSPGLRRMIMSEKPNDGTVAMHYGDVEDGDYLNSEDHMPTLPNTHLADLLAAQFCTLMIREGYYVEDHVTPRPTRISIPSNSQNTAPCFTPNNSTGDMQQYPESASGPQTSETKPTITSAPLNSTSNLLPSSGMLPPGNSQALQMSQGLVPGVSMSPRPQQMDPQQALQQQQQQQLMQQQQLPLQNQPSLMSQQQPQFSRSPLMLPTNSMPQLNTFAPSSNLPLGNHMGNRSSPLQLLQQQQPQQGAQVQRRMMMGLGPAVAMGGIGNNMVGLGGLGNVMGMGGARGMSGTGISSPMGPISGMAGSMAQNPLSMSQANAISQHIRAGTLTQHQAQAVMAQRLKLMQSRGMLGGTQPGVAGGARQMQPGSAGLSMLGQTLNRGNISPMQRTAMGQMGMPKLMTGMNIPMNQQQQLQLQQQQQQQHQHLQQQQMQQQLQLQQQQQQQPQQQQQMQHQEATSPLQAVLSPQQVGSPSTLGIPHQQVTQQQQASPQQMAQRTPMSPPLSSGPMHPMSAGNPEACPASPALSSQTLGSVGSITNSPMDLQGVNKSNSVPNT